MSFLNPTYLWALLGLLIPIIIHFWSNRSGKTIKVGSVQFLKESESSQSRSIRLNEIALLILRLSLITVLIFILAEPVWKTTTKKSALTYLVEPSLLENQDLKNMIDSISEVDDVRLLTKGFPLYEEIEAIGSGPVPHYWHLAQQFETLKTDSVVVFSKALRQGIKGARPEISVKSSWIVLNEDEPNSIPVQAYKDEDSIQLYSVERHSDMLAFNKITLASGSSQLRPHETPDSIVVSSSKSELTVPLKIKDTLNILVVDDATTNNSVRIMTNALQAIETYTKIPFSIEVTDSYNKAAEDFDLLIWNSTGAPPQTTAKQLVYQPNGLSKRLISTSPTANQWFLTATLNSENVVNDHFAEQLMTILGIHKEVEKHARAIDQRQISPALLTPKFRADATTHVQKATLTLSNWLWLLFVPLLLLERIMSKFRKQ